MGLVAKHARQRDDLATCSVFEAALSSISVGRSAITSEAEQLNSKVATAARTKALHLALATGGVPLDDLCATAASYASSSVPLPPTEPMTSDS